MNSIILHPFIFIISYSYIILILSRKNIHSFMQQYFKVPDQQSRKIAIGSLPGLPFRIKKSLEQVIPLFKPVSKPEQGDWLWDHQEQGQTYDAYKGQLHNEVDGKRNVIYIKPLQKQIDAQFLLKLKTYCECFFHPLKVQIMKQTNILEGVGHRINEYTEKQQYNAKDILIKLQKSLKPDAFCLLGVAFTDLYPKDQWNFVFGLASIRDRTGVFSFARYDPRFFQENQYKPNYDEVFWRAAGVMAHQTTHMFGVRHCIFFDCLMNGSNHDKESAKKPLQLCPVCLRKLQSNIKFDILERYKKIRDFINSKQVPMPKKLEEYLNTVIPKISKELKQE